VVNNVSAAVRAFWLNGQKARFDGVDSRTGEKKYKCVSVMKDESARNFAKLHKMSKGTTLEFRLSPTITALSTFPASLGAAGVAATKTLGTDGLLDLLATDFARALKDLAAILTDLKRLSSLGDLPLTISDKNGSGSALQVRFAGCDAQAVERLCDEVGVHRGIIRQDEDFDPAKDVEMALLFPFAPGADPSETSETEAEGMDVYFSTKSAPRPEKVDWRGMLSSPEHTVTRPESLGDGFDLVEDAQNPWLTSSPSGYSSMHDSDYEDGGHVAQDLYQHEYAASSVKYSKASEYEGVEGIYKFLQECEDAKR